jgi:hypothetical protein
LRLSSPSLLSSPPFLCPEIPFSISLFGHVNPTKKKKAKIKKKKESGGDGRLSGLKDSISFQDMCIYLFAQPFGTAFEINFQK